MIKHVKGPSSYDSLRNGWRIERLKGCWLAGVSLLPHWPARTENWLFCQNTKYIIIVFLLSYRVRGGGGEWEWQRGERREFLHLWFFVIMLQRNPLVTLLEERTSYLYLALAEGNTFSSFHFFFSNVFIYLFKCWPCQKEKGYLTWLPDGKSFQKKTQFPVENRRKRNTLILNWSDFLNRHMTPCF